MIGVAGCGRMGAPMLAALCRAGFDARGFDVRPVDDFGDLRMAMVGDPTAFAEHLVTLLIVVRDQPQTEDVLFGAQGFAAAPNLDTVIICSTLSPRYILRLRDRLPKSIALIDAPISGAAIAAKETRLSFMLGGDAGALDRHQPIFNALGRHFHRMGGLGAGMQAKVLNNLLAASHTAMTRLVLDWADATGLDRRALLDVVASSSGQNWFASGAETIEFFGDGHAVDNSIGILAKDIDSALDAAPAGAETSLPQAVRDAITRLGRLS